MVSRRQSQDFKNLVDVFEIGGGRKDMIQPSLRKTVGQELNPSFLKDSEFLEYKGRGAVKKSHSIIRKSMISERGPSGHNRPSLCPAVKRGREMKVMGQKDRNILKTEILLYFEDLYPKFVEHGINFWQFFF